VVSRARTLAFERPTGLDEELRDYRFREPVLPLIPLFRPARAAPRAAGAVVALRETRRMFRSSFLRSPAGAYRRSQTLRSSARAAPREAGAVVALRETESMFRSSFLRSPAGACRRSQSDQPALDCSSILATAAASRSARELTCSRRGALGISTRLGTASTSAPAALPARQPVSESSSTTQW
jgi:hypothetical protein